MILIRGLDVVVDILDAGIKTIALVLDARNGLWNDDLCRRVYMMDLQQTESSLLVFM